MVLEEGIKAAADVKISTLDDEATKITNQSKRKAGALATASQLAGQGLNKLGEKRKKREVGGEDGYYDSQIAKQTGKAVNLREQAGAINLTEGLPSVDSSVDSGTTENTKAVDSGTSAIKTDVSAPASPAKAVTAPGGRAANFNTILKLANDHGGFKFPEVVAAQAMHENWLDG